MKNIELLPLTGEAKKRLNEFALQYKRFAGIVVEIVSFDDNRLIVRVEQKEADVKQLTKVELEQRIKDMFSGEIPAEWRLTISAVDFDRKDIDAVNVPWIMASMERHSLKAKHLSTYTGIDKSTLSILLNENRELTKWQKVAFYYFFKYYDVSGFKEKP